MKGANSHQGSDNGPRARLARLFAASFAAAAVSLSLLVATLFLLPRGSVGSAVISIDDLGRVFVLVGLVGLPIAFAVVLVFGSLANGICDTMGVSEHRLSILTILGATIGGVLVPFLWLWFWGIQDASASVPGLVCGLAGGFVFGTVMKRG